MPNGQPEGTTQNTERVRKFFNGALPIYRRELLLLREKKLKNFAALGSWFALVLSADWDPKHPRYGCIPSDAEIARRLRIDPSTAQRHRTELLKAGLLLERSDGEFEIKGFWKYGRVKELAGISAASLQEEDAALQNLNASVHEADAQAHVPPRHGGNDPDTGPGSVERRYEHPRANMQEGISLKEQLDKLRESTKERLNQTSLSRPLSLVNDTPSRNSSRRSSSEMGCSECGTLVPSVLQETTVKQYGRPLCVGCAVKEGRKKMV